MTKMHKPCAALTSALFFVASASTGYAEKLSGFWQEPRDYYNQLSDEACDGDGAALRKLMVAAIKDDHPVAQHDLAWVYHTKRCVFAAEDRREATDLERQSADAGYPVAQSNYAISLIKGLGTDQDTDLGVQYIERAIAAGYGTAAATYAKYLLTGKYFTKDREKAQEYYEVAQELGADQDMLDEVAELLGARDKAEPFLTATDAWVYEDGEAGWDMIRDGRVVARVFLGFNEYINEYYYGVTRVSDDPIIHFMGASISAADGTKSELKMGGCGGADCLVEYEPANNASGSKVVINIPAWFEDETLESIKSGKEIVFGYQTEDSARNNNYIKLGFRLDGSRKAINKVQVWADDIRVDASDPSQVFTAPSRQAAEQSGGGGATATTYYEGDVEHGDVLCTAAEIADYPPYFYSELPAYLQEVFTLDPTKRIKPASTAFLKDAGTSVWTFGASEHLVMYKGGRAVAVRAGARNGAEEKYEGTWDVSAKGITVQVSGNPGYNVGNHNISCKGGTMVLDTMSTPGNGPNGYTEWKGCMIMTFCDDWHDKKPSQIRADVKTMRLVEWSPGNLPTSQMRWVQEAIKP